MNMNRERNTTISKGRGLAQVNETSVLREAKCQLGHQGMDWGAKRGGTAMCRKRSLMEYSAGKLTSMALLLKGEILVPGDQGIIPGFLGDATRMNASNRLPPPERVQ